MSKPRIVGELVIVAYKAKDLPEREVIRETGICHLEVEINFLNEEIVGKQDPFVVFRIGETIKKTKTDLGGGQRPTWDDQVTLPIPEKKKMVVVQVYDEDAKRQELISECELDISKVLEEGEEDNWYELQYRGRPAGEIYLEMTFYTAKPPPRRQPTRYGMSKQHPRPTGFATRPPLPQQQIPPHYITASPYPPQPTTVRPVAPTPVESHSTPTYNASPYPPAQQHQQRPQYNMTPHTAPYPPPVPTPSMSTGSQHIYPPQQQQQQQPRPIPPSNNSRPTSYQGPPGHTSRPTSPPNASSYGSNNSASLLSSSYNPSNASNNGPPRPNYGGGGYPVQHNNSIYPPSSGGNNRNSFPGYSNTSSPYPQPQHFGGFPEPQQFGSGYIPHADPLGTPFAAHQGSFHTPQHNTGYPPNNNYPPHQPQQGYPPNNGGYPPQHGYPPY
ncbi:unnamed protein product [Mucor hiemalis]